MASDSFLQSYDLAIKYVLYDKFASILGIDAHYEIDSVSLVNNSVIILGDFADGFPAEDRISIQSSTDNNGTYTVVSAGYADGKTTIVLTETLSSTTADGTIYRSEETNINLGVIQYPKAVAQRVAAEKRDQTFLEFINFWRVGASFSWARNRTPLSRRGMSVAISEDGTEIIQVTAVPIDLSYDAWFWSKDRDKMYQVIEDYVFWQQNNPNVSLLYTDLHDNTYELTPDLHFGEIVDESTIEEQYQKGIIHVCRMPIKLDAWVLKGLSFKTIYKIKFTLRDKDEVTDYEEIMIEDSDQNTELEAILRFSREAIYNIYEIDLSDNTISIQGSYTTDFTVGQKIQIADSTDNDNVYTVTKNASCVDDITVVTVDEALTSATADGIVSLKNVQ